jgi:hypothetical protein
MQPVEKPEQAPPWWSLPLSASYFLPCFSGSSKFGLLIYNQQVVTNAGREGARHGIVARPDDYKITKNNIY